MNNLFNGKSSVIRGVSSNAAEQKATYRFLDNENVTEPELIKACCERTGQLCKGKHVLVLSDTTEINLQRHIGRLEQDSGVGLVGNNRDIGFFAHLGLVIDAEAYQALGFSSIQLWHRPETKESKEQRDYDNLPIEDKESYKWIGCGKDSKELLKDAESITVISDRESDIYEMFTDLPDGKTHLIIRSRFNRYTEEGSRIYERLEKSTAAGSYTIDIGENLRRKTQKRTAKLEVKYCEVFIKKPGKKKGKDEREEQIKIWVVEAKETGKTNGVCWRLLTTHKIESFTDALQVIQWYRARWWIEEVFRLLKSKGYQIEDSQLENGWAIRKLTIMILQTILRVMQMLVAYHSNEKQDAKIAFTEDEIVCLEKVGKQNEGKSEKLKNPSIKGTLKWAAWIIARLGGWKGYESQRNPGPITIKNGLDKFQNIYNGWCIAMATLEEDVGTQ